MSTATHMFVGWQESGIAGQRDSGKMGWLFRLCGRARNLNNEDILLIQEIQLATHTKANKLAHIGQQLQWRPGIRQPPTSDLRPPTSNLQPPTLPHRTCQAFLGLGLVHPRRPSSPQLLLAGAFPISHFPPRLVFSA